MNPLFILLGVGGALYFFNKAGSIQQMLSDRSAPKSGIQWTSSLNVGDGSTTVWAPANPPLHDKYPVLVTIKGSDGRLYLSSRYDNVPSDIFMAAMRDFNVLQASY